MSAIYSSAMNDKMEEVLQLKSRDEIMNDEGRYVFNRRSRKYEPFEEQRLSFSQHSSTSEEEFFDSPEDNINVQTVQYSRVRQAVR